MTTVQESITWADTAASVFDEIRRSDQLLVAEVLLHRARTGAEVQEVLDRVDLDCELSEAAQEIIHLHADEPIEGILAIVIYLLLDHPVEKSCHYANFL